MSILDRRLDETPLAVIDLETTGLSATSDRIVEIAVVRVDPGQAPRLVLDTLVDPQRRVTCSEVHGIYEEDVEGAPLFRELLDPISTAVDGAVVGAYNVYFDMKFLEAELGAARVPLPLPHLCLMWLRPALGLGPRTSLENTCSALGVQPGTAHRAATDAMATAALWSHYVRSATAQGIHTFGELAAHKSYKFTASWDAVMLARASLKPKPLTTSLKARRDRSDRERREVRTREWFAEPPRSEVSDQERKEDRASRIARIEREPLAPRADVAPTPRTSFSIDGTAIYWQALTAALVDQMITPEEFVDLRRLQLAAGITPERLRWVHARVFSGLLDDFSSDELISEAEVSWLAHVHRALGELGWAPGVGAVQSERTESASSERPRVQILPADSSGWWSRMFGQSP